MADINNELSIEVVTAWPLTERQIQGWHNLASTHYNPNIFLTLDWLQLWWKYFAKKNDRLHIVFISISNNIVGLCPFYLQNEKILRFIGTGEPVASEVCSEYLDVLIDKSNQTMVLNVIEQQLAGLTKRVNRVHFNNVLKGSYILTIANKLKKQCFIKERCVGLRYSVVLPKCYQEYTASLSKKFIGQMQRKQRKLSKLQGTFVEVNNKADLNLYFHHLQQLHNDRWSKKELAGAFSEELFINFHQKFTQLLLSKNQLSMKALIIEDRVMGVIYNFKYCGTRFFYQIGIDMNYKQNVSLGSQLHLAEIKSAISNNDDAYDFMKGTIVNSYKTNFANKTTEMVDILLIKKSFSKVFHLLEWLTKSIWK